MQVYNKIKGTIHLKKLLGQRDPEKGPLHWGQTPFRVNNWPSCWSYSASSWLISRSSLTRNGVWPQWTLFRVTPTRVFWECCTGGGGGTSICAYWVCATRETPIFSIKISAPEHIIFNNDNNKKPIWSITILQFLPLLSGDHHFQNVFITVPSPPTAAASPNAKRTDFAILSCIQPVWHIVPVVVTWMTQGGITRA